jgi:hypothetical protein
LPGYDGGFAFAKAEQRRDCVGSVVGCAAAKSANRGRDAASLCRCGARFPERARDQSSEGEDQKILRVDLDGDGEDEVLLNATNYFTEDESVPTGAPPGSDSVVLLRRVVAGKVQTQVVAGEIHADGKHFNAPNYYDVTAVLDLDGDGKLEVVVHSGYYEGGSTTIYRCEPGKIMPLLEVDCGV